MNCICLENIVPDVFGAQLHASEVWGCRLNLEKGKKYLIEAASGTGKSSLCSFVYGMRNDYSGRIMFDSVCAGELDESQWRKVRLSSISIMFQDLRQFRELTAFENVVLKNSLTGYKTEEEIKEMFFRLGLEEKIDSPLGLMSLGQQQRVAFIRSLCQPFDFIFLDEPVSHIDDENASVMSSMLADELERRGACAVTTSIGRHLVLDYDKTLSL